MTTSPPAAAAPAGTIVVGVDDSEAADRALAWAAGLASAEDREITALHATGSKPPVLGGRSEPDDGASPGSLRAAGGQVTSRARWTLRKDGFDGAVHEAGVASSAVAALTEASRTAEVVVVGAREHGPLGIFVLGSVSRALVGHAHCPVVVVPAPGGSGGTGGPGAPEEPVDRPQHGVLVAVDDGRPSHGAIDFAFAQASLRAVPLTVLGCVLTPASVYTGTAELDQADPDAELEKRVLGDLVAEQAERLPDVAVSVEADQGRPEEAIVRAASRHELVVLGAGTHSWLSRMLTRDVDRWVLAHAACPVAVVPDPQTASPTEPD